MPEPEPLPNGGGWEVDFADIPLLTISTDEHATGELNLELVLASTGESDSVVVHVEPVVDEPSLVASDVVGYVNNPLVLARSPISVEATGKLTKQH